ncbi:hypothetical protein [Siphonobacter sp. SORGH_AS_1065]|uniref:hypothetical protein n=1 Tax=Siphonobacter sp. SORGH_AS_1065 TaxID=3041795 RepID=UPI002781758D|nr:hypothetical protein [Siphonobacter sp. SORGH_AS_1065]MDQ1088682.1 hypothetical protein [Siphonobacter sp. SORGH_AS_1065]
MKRMVRTPILMAGAFFALVSLSSLTDPKPLYKNASLPTHRRVQDLLKRMTTEEKVGQLATPLGWFMYDKNGSQVTVSEKFKKAVKEQQIGMLWATLRADPWTQKTLKNGLESRAGGSGYQRFTEIRH